MLIRIEGEADGVPMGVLEDGSAFVSVRGLARLCGVTHKTIQEQLEAWDLGRPYQAMARILFEHDIKEGSLLVQPFGSQERQVVSEAVATAFIEYYAFEMNKEGARRTLRLLSRAGLRLFVYTAIGYRPEDALSPGWRQFHDRCLFNPAPKGYFFVFSRLASFVLTAIRNGLIVDQGTIPDISAGRCWSDYWQEHHLDDAYGERIKASHSYPNYFPQSAANPQDAYAYPIAAAGAFEVWLEDVYLPDKFPAYIKKKVKKGDIEAEDATRILQVVVPAQLKA